MIRFTPLLLATLTSPVLAQGFADLDEVDRQVSAFVGQPAPPVDRRLRLARCTAPLALDWYGSARQAVQVRCPSAGGWTLYVTMPAAVASAAAPPLIQRGDSVTIQVGGDGWAVSQPGEALEPGAAGTWIKVRGVTPKAPVLRGRVLRPGLVGVDLP